MSLDEQQMKPHERGGDCRQDRNMKAEEARQRSAGDVIATSQKPGKTVSNDRYTRGDVGAHAGRKERHLVPRQQVTGEAKR